MATAQPAPAILCSVLGESLGRGMRFRGRIVSPDDLAGTYRLVITKRGPSGTSSINQGGGFAAAAGTEVFVGGATVGLEAGAGYEASLDLEAGGRTVTCAMLRGDKR